MDFKSDVLNCACGVLPAPARRRSARFSLKSMSPGTPGLERLNLLLLFWPCERVKLAALRTCRVASDFDFLSVFLRVVVDFDGATADLLVRCLDLSMFTVVWYDVK